MSRDTHKAAAVTATAAQTEPPARWRAGDPPPRLPAPHGTNVEDQSHTLWFHVTASEAGVPSP